MNTTISDFGKDKKANGGEGIYENIAQEGYFNSGLLKTGRLCIDEKDIQGQVYTILTNADEGELIMLCPGTKIDDVVRFVRKHSREERRTSVREVCCDMSSTMEGIITRLFPNAQIVSDRFHVMSNELEDVGAIRTRAKTAVKKRINEEQKEYAQLKQKEETEKKEGRGRPRTTMPQKRLANGETEIEVVTRVVRQVRKRKQDRNTNQRERRVIAKQISELSDLIEGYEYLHALRDIYDQHLKVEEGKQKIRQRLADGLVLRTRIDEVDNFMSTIERRFDSVCNYFISRHSNGFAEGFHSRIQKLISMSRGFISKDYMIYRIIKLASTNSTCF